MTVPVILGRARRPSVSQAPHFKTLSPSEGTDDRLGHPRTSETLVRTTPESILTSPLRSAEQSPLPHSPAPARSHSLHLALTPALKLH